MSHLTLVVTAGLFAVLTGLNDGATILAASLRVPVLRPLTRVVALTAAVAVVPLMFGVAVATTFTVRLVGFEGRSGETAFVVAVVSAMAVVLVLGRRGLPTSLTLALVGAIAGSGLGSGSPVAWGVVALTLLLAAAAPLVASVAAFGCARVLFGARSKGPVGPRVRRTDQVGFGLQCLAYALNDGQKMIAVGALAAGSGAAVSAAVVTVGPMVALAGCFAVGCLLGLRRSAATLGSGLFLVRPVHAISATVSSAAVVLGGAVFGAPMSMTQAIAGGLVGSGARDGYGRVRWHHAVRIAGAWVLTLPIAFALAGLAAAVVRLGT